MDSSSEFTPRHRDFELAGLAFHRNAMREIAVDGVFDRVLGLLHRDLQLLLRLHGRRHVGGVLHHLERLAIGIRNRVVRGLDPDLAAALGEPLEVADSHSPRLSLAQNARYSALAANALSANML